MSGKKRVLIADDDVTAHDLWRDILSSWGYEVAFAEDGEKALELIGSFRPNILLCDLRMPRRDGLELLGDINESGPALITLMISGVSEIPDAVRSIKLGAYDYLTKPLDLHRLEILLENLSDHVSIPQ